MFPSVQKLSPNFFFQFTYTLKRTHQKAFFRQIKYDETEVFQSIPDLNFNVCVTGHVKESIFDQVFLFT